MSDDMAEMNEAMQKIFKILEPLSPNQRAAVMTVVVEKHLKEFEDDEG